METSDSEYFESADEDLSSSDYEEEKSKHSVKQNLNQELIKDKICKPKDERTIHLNEGIKVGISDVESGREKDQNQSDSDGGGIEMTRNIQEKTKTDTENIGSKKSQSSSEKSNIASPVSTCDNKNLDASSTDVIKENKLSFSSEDFKGTVLTKNANTQIKNTETDNFKEIITPVSKSKQNTSQNQTDKIEIKSEQELKLEPEKDDNLWNDDEFDWESEAAKDQSQKTVKQNINPENEDGGWDDFDVDWEPESTLSSKSKTAQPNLKLSLIEGNNKSDKNVSSVEENLWEDDDWEPLEKPEDKTKQTEEHSGWGGWGSWDVSTLLNTATQGVSTLTSHVSQGLSTVLETGINIPDPEELAKMNKTNKEGNAPEKYKIEEKDTRQVNDDSPGFGLDNLVLGMTQLTKFVESTGTKVITGGLDTLEAIGKKTVEVLQEGDPGLKKKRAFLKLDPGKPNLSQILREAKERAEEENQAHQQKHSEVKRMKNYEALFDDHQGLVHLEALEMLSKLCIIKLSNLNNSLNGDALKDMQETLEQIKELTELPEDEEEKISFEGGKEIITNAVNEISIPISYDKLFLTYEESDIWLQNVNLDFIDDTELHQQAIETLAQLTAFAVEQFHKAGELLMVKEHRSTADEADSLVQITTTLKSLITGQAVKFSDKLSSVKNANKDDISEHITNIFYEAANSGRYIQDAFQLLIPVLQVGAV